jgi:hypothetical protein
MPITTTDIVFRQSGGAANANMNASLGGAVSANNVTSALFDDVQSSEASAGDIEYRCIYVRNAHPTLTLIGAVLWLTSNTTGNRVFIGLGTSAINGTEQTIADENTAPVGVSFSQPSTKGTALTIGDLAPSATKAFWFRRTIPASTAGGTDTFNYRVEGDTAP